MYLFSYFFLLKKIMKKILKWENQSLYIYKKLN